MNEYDDLDRALRALPLEEPPPGLHQAILAATVYRPGLPFKAWETWILGTLTAVAIWLALFVRFGLSNDRLTDIVQRGVNTVSELAAGSSATLVWLALGISIVLWVSNLDVPAIGILPRRHAR